VKIYSSEDLFVTISSSIYMAELIAKIILGGSLAGIGAILIKKIPFLKETPEIQIKTIEERRLILRLIIRLKSLIPSSSNLFSQKIFSKIKILTLRIEKRAEEKLQKLREEAKRITERKNDNYWEELKKSKEQKK